MERQGRPTTPADRPLRWHRRRGRSGALRPRPRPRDRRTRRRPQRRRHRSVRRRDRDRPLGDARRLGRSRRQHGPRPRWRPVGRCRPRDTGARSGHHGRHREPHRRRRRQPGWWHRLAHAQARAHRRQSRGGRGGHRGGRHRAGVVSSFRFALHPVGPTVMAGPVFWAAEDTTDVLRFYRDFVADAPDELGTVIRLGTIPPLPAVGDQLHFRPAIAVASCYAVPVEAGERAVRALRQFGTPLVDLVGPTLYVDYQRGIDDTVPHGWHYYWKATNLTVLSDEVIDIVAEHAYGATSPRSYAAMFHMGGAVARAPRGATAYPERDVDHNMSIDAVWLPEQDDTVGAAETAWARAFLDALESHRAGVYVNFLDSDDDTSRVREAYGDANYRRLAEVKAKYAPDNVFHNNKNIQPSTP